MEFFRKISQQLQKQELQVSIKDERPPPCAKDNDQISILHATVRNHEALEPPTRESIDKEHLFDGIRNDTLFSAEDTSNVSPSPCLDLVYFPEVKYKTDARKTPEKGNIVRWRECAGDKRNMKKIFDYIRLDPVMEYYVCSHRSGWYVMENDDDGIYSCMIKDFLYMMVWTFDPKTLHTRAIVVERSDYHLRSMLKTHDGYFDIPGLCKEHLYHPFSLACIGLIDTVFYFDFVVIEESHKIGDIERNTGHGAWAHRTLAEKEQRQEESRKAGPDSPLSGTTLEARNLTHTTQADSSDGDWQSASDDPNATAKEKNESRKKETQKQIKILMDNSRNIARMIGVFANLWKSVGIAESIMEVLEDQEELNAWFQQRYGGGGSGHGPDSEKIYRNHLDCSKSLRKAAKLLRLRIKTIQQSGSSYDNRAKAQSGVISALIRREDSILGIEIAAAGTKLAEATQRDSQDMKAIAVMTMAFLPATFFAALFTIPYLQNAVTAKGNFWIYWLCTILTTVAVFAVWDLTNHQQIFKRSCRYVGQKLGLGWGGGGGGRLRRRAPVRDEEGNFEEAERAVVVELGEPPRLNTAGSRQVGGGLGHGSRPSQQRTTTTWSGKVDEHRRAS